MTKGTLTIVGTGIKFGGHVTDEARGHIRRADRVLYGVADPATGAWIKQVNANAEPLPFYEAGRPRRDTYERWIDLMLRAVRDGSILCVVFYGHPGVYVYPSHEAVRRAREEGYEAGMLPGISAEDCLIADLGFDPAHRGCRSFEATDFLIRSRPIDVCTPLLLWQIGLTGTIDYVPDQTNLRGLEILADVLTRTYGEAHEVTVYEAAQFAVFDPIIRRVPLRELTTTPITASSTLYVPPREDAPIDFAMADRLGLPRDQVERLFGASS